MWSNSSIIPLIGFALTLALVVFMNAARPQIVLIHHCTLKTEYQSTLADLSKAMLWFAQTTVSKGEAKYFANGSTKSRLIFLIC
jgi:hypothetical protein